MAGKQEREKKELERQRQFEKKLEIMLPLPPAVLNRPEDADLFRIRTMMRNEIIKKEMVNRDNIKKKELQLEETLKRSGSTETLPPHIPPAVLNISTQGGSQQQGNGPRQPIENPHPLSQSRPSLHQAGGFQSSLDNNKLQGYINPDLGKFKFVESSIEACDAQIVDEILGAGPQKKARKKKDVKRSSAQKADRPQEKRRRVKDESGNFKIPSVMQDETVKASERECDGAIKQKTVALDERTNDFKELHQERGLELRKSIKHREKIQILKALKEENLTKVGPPIKTFSADKRFSLGRGSMGTSVYVGILEDGSEVAVKRLLIESSKDAAENERNILSLSNTEKSPFIVSYRHFLKDNTFMYLIVDLCEETLDEYVPFQSIQHLRIHGRRMIKEVLTGLKFLHNKKILHRDLKPSNVLVDVQGHMRLADFGISRVLNEDETTVHTDAKGTRGWMAAEVIKTINQVGKGRFKRKSDIQSAGMIAFFILTKGGHPFGDTLYERMTNIVNGNPINLDDLDEVDDRQFVSLLISHKIDDRPYAHEALLQPLMDNIH